MTADDTIRRAADVIDVACRGHVFISEEVRGVLARALADDGLLTPAPLHEETEIDRVVLFGGRDARVTARRRWVTGWQAAPDLLSDDALRSVHPAAESWPE